MLTTQKEVRAGAWWQAIGASRYPFSPSGFGQHVTAIPGGHMGRRVHWSDLPADVQRFARQSFPEFCPEVTK